MMRRWITIPLVTCLLAITLLSGCERSQEEADAILTELGPQDPQPSGILTIWADQNTLTDIPKEIEQPLQQIYPKLTIQTKYFVNANQLSGKKIEDLVASGEVPDIIFADSGKLPLLAKYRLLEGLDNMAENTLDIEPFNPSIMEYIRSHNGYLLGVPYASNVHALFYNKNIFDELDIPYPSDDMTWGEVFELAGQVGVRAEGKYLPLDIVHPDLLVSQSSLTYIDPATGKANFDTDSWQALMSMMQEIPRIPGNDKVVFYQDRSLYVGFNPFELGHIAMAAGALEGEPVFSFRSSALDRSKSNRFDWDIASFPVASREAGGPVPSFLFLGIHPESEHKWEAFQAINWLVSKEKQETNVTKARASARTDINMADKFGEDHYIWKQKNLGAYFTNRDTVPVGSAYEDGSLAMQAEYPLSLLIRSKNTDRSEIIASLTRQIDVLMKTLTAQ